MNTKVNSLNFRLKNPEMRKKSIKIIKSFDFKAFFHINLCTFSGGIYYRRKMYKTSSLTSYPQEDETSNGEVNNHDT